MERHKADAMEMEPLPPKPEQDIPREVEDLRVIRDTFVRYLPCINVKGGLLFNL